MNTDPIFNQAFRKRRGTSLARVLTTCFAHLGLWGLCSVILWAGFFVSVQVYFRLWLPAGLADPALEQVVGDSWAFTRDGRGFYLHRGHWKQVDVQSQNGPLMWGLGGDGSMVIAGNDGLLYAELNTDLIPLPRPALTGTLLSVGGAFLCPAGRGFVDAVYAATESELALYNLTGKTWKVMPLAQPVSGPMVSCECRLFWLAPSGSLSTITLNIPADANFDAITLDQSSADLSAYGGASSLASSSNTVWVLTPSGKVLTIASFSQYALPLEVLPTPPPLTNPRLSAGVSGVSFLATDKYVDLWLSGDEAIYGYNWNKQAWQKFGSIYGARPRLLSSLTNKWESEMGVTRLAVVDGRVFRQQYEGGFYLILLFCASIPLAVLIGLPVSLLLAFFLCRKRVI